MGANPGSHLEILYDLYAKGKREEPAKQFNVVCEVPELHWASMCWNSPEGKSVPGSTTYIGCD